MTTSHGLLGLLIVTSLSIVGPAWSADAPHHGHAHGPWITLYSSDHYEGHSVTIDDAVPNLDAYDFNDRARSARVRGVWLICAGKNFREDCVTIDHDVSNLSAYGMKKRAGSVRPRFHRD